MNVIQYASMPPKIAGMIALSTNACSFTEVALIPRLCAASSLSRTALTM